MIHCYGFSPETPAAVYSPIPQSNSYTTLKQSITVTFDLEISFSAKKMCQRCRSKTVQLTASYIKGKVEAQTQTQSNFIYTCDRQ